MKVVDYAWMSWSSRDSRGQWVQDITSDSSLRCRACGHRIAMTPETLPSLQLECFCDSAAALRGRMTPHVTFLIPACGERGLANLARDAIAKFTADVSHEVHLLDHQRGAPWPESGSESNALSLMTMLRGVSPFATHVFAMHDDALPIRAGWLSYLLSKPGPVVGVKLSQRSGMAHPSGVLWTREFAMENIDRIPPELPARDVGEFAASWCATAFTWRPDEHPRESWIRGATPTLTRVSGDPRRWPWHFDCDISLNDQGSPFYAHLGGGSIGAGRESFWGHRRRVDAWIEAAREALGL